MPDWIALLDTPLDVAAATTAVLHPRAGGVDVFLGTTRAERRSDGVELVALDYEAYTEMAVEQIHAIARDARTRWPVERLAMLHRTGVVGLAEPSVIVAASCPHRGEAFEATRFLIDELKRVAAIWKREVWADGETSWVAGTPVK
jgi:molybdopterin synthase catalytic subunit